ncbi:type II toxin-antitoxin system Phd/YefM family antitoxin [Streptomyces sp. NBC_00536]|uniref:type II toxin-antitoxin system Phd/YefM family antitoxin n=1 Tax=Streptomyces sp. NBC_00536 TaxID=2975769 RepID=UPI002E81E65E|nr:type II toxin-antitoxin system Phd/YefM family antitoxin [Streptomyces sp. NBC_00536]WUC81329.1 type II toxin-antitoxin system Phd/YefM family antitoxin [Streptomyces sp. NBC_00536]
MDDSVSIREARANLAKLLDQAQEGEPTVITRGGAPVAAIVPIEEYNALEDAADEILARRARQILAGEADVPRASPAEVLADIFGTGASGAA